MNRVTETLRVLFVSPEFVWLLLSGAGLAFVPTWLRATWKILPPHGESAAIVLGAAAALAVATYKGSDRVRRPESKRLALAGWKDYWRLRIRVNTALFWSGCGVLGAIVGLAVGATGHPARGAATIIAFLGASAIALTTVAKAIHDVEDIVEGIDSLKSAP